MEGEVSKNKYFGEWGASLVEYGLLLSLLALLAIPAVNQLGNAINCKLDVKFTVASGQARPSEGSVPSPCQNESESGHDEDKDDDEKMKD